MVEAVSDVRVAVNGRDLYRDGDLSMKERLFSE